MLQITEERNNKSHYIPLVEIAYGAGEAKKINILYDLLSFKGHTVKMPGRDVIWILLYTRTGSI